MTQQNCKIFTLLLLCIMSASLYAQSGESNTRPFNTFNLRNLRFDFFISAARSLAMGGTAIALADDPSAAVVNPAGVAFFIRPAISSSTRMTTQKHKEPSFDCDNPGNSITDRDFFFDQTLLSAIVPVVGNLYISTFRETVFDSRISFSATRPLEFGNASSAANVIQENFPSQRTVLRMQVVDNGASASWRFSENVQFGTSLRMTRFEYRLTDQQYYASNYGNHPSETCVPNSINADNLYLIQTVDNKKWGVGIGAGLVARITPRLTFGAIFHHRASFDLDSRIFLPRYVVNRGDSTITFPSRVDTTTRLRFNIPDSYGFGLAYKYRNWLTLSMDLIRIQYSELLSSASIGAGGRDPRDLIQDNAPGEVSEPLGGVDLTQDDRWEFHAGLEYIFRIPPKRLRLPVRFGYYYNPSHIIHASKNEPQFDFAFPDSGDEHHFTFGLGFFWGKRLRLDGAVNAAGDSFEFVGTSVYVF